MKTIYENRLKKFAQHLQPISNHIEKYITRRCNLVNLENNIRMEIEMEYSHWVMEELVDFDEENWGWDKITGDPVLEKMRTENTITCLCFYFDLNPDSLTHLFDISVRMDGTGFQNAERWGGEQITIESDGDVYAKNIIEFIQKSDTEL